MVSSAAKTVDEYLKELPEDRRIVISKVRDVVRKNMPKGYRERMSWGMITWDLPLEKYPNTYNGQPLCYAGLAAQKNYFALYLVGAYVDPKQVKVLQDAYRKAGKKMDMGKSCLRFKKLEDLPLDAIAKVIASTPPDEMIRFTEAAHSKKK